MLLWMTNVHLELVLFDKMHKEYSSFGDEYTKTIEELAELIQAITKIQRFGLYSYNPEDRHKVTNLKHVLEEISDVENALANLKDRIAFDS